ncbi:MAG: BMA_0021/BMA_0022 family TOMM bacteriocin [Myxococcota bacterium]
MSDEKKNAGNSGESGGNNGGDPDCGDNRQPKSHQILDHLHDIIEKHAERVDYARDPDVVNDEETSLIKEYVDHTLFQSVWLRAVGRAWMDSDFRDALLKDARAAFKAAFDYTLPEHMELVVYEPQSGGWDKQASYEQGTGKNPDTWHLPKSYVLMPLPQKPLEDCDQGMAMGDYYDSGRTYPFSCF